MTKVLAVDPQVHFAAWAYVREFRLQAVGIEHDCTGGKRTAHIANLLRSCLFVGGAIMPDIVIVEKPVVYSFRQQKGDQNDLIRLSIAGGVVGAAFAALSPNCTVLFIEPRKWKGTIDKTPHHNRLRRDYPHIVPIVNTILPKGLRGHVYDAVALALWYVERERTRNAINRNPVTSKKTP